MNGDAAAIWESVARVLADQVSDAVWQTTFRELRGQSFDGRQLTLAAPSLLVRERVQRYEGLMNAALKDAGAPDIGIDIVVETVDEGEDPEEFGAPLPHRSASIPGAGHHLSSGNDQDGRLRSDGGGRQLGPLTPSHGADGSDSDGLENLNPKYTFESFVTGPSNRFAQAAALSVAETPARSYNPLFVYGAAGLGKTHLLQAIAHYVLKNYPGYRVRYISTEKLLNEFVDAIRTGSQLDFKRRYREIDVLLVDDIQFMEGKEQLQEEFFHTFNTLHEANRQIVLSSDRPPDAIATLEDRLRSRFKMGLITDIQTPDFETRLAIVLKKAERTNVHLPEPVLEFIVTHITNNIRELEGALNRVSAYAALNHTSPTLDMARHVLSDIIVDHEPQRITPEMILEAVSRKYGFTVEEIRSRSRRRPLVIARQVGMYLFRDLTDFSYPQIASEFGGRDHTTVIHGYEKIRNLMAERRAIYEDVTALLKQLKSPIR